MHPSPSLLCPWPGSRVRPWQNAFRRWWYHRSPPSHPFQRVEAPVDWPELVPGAARDFRHYLTGESQVQVTSLDEVCRWLLVCRYAPDQGLAHCEDHWQHPLEFERSRWGDCEDHALWGWRQLKNLGLPVEFVVGLLKPGPNEQLANHAWLHVHDGQRMLLVETTATCREAMALAVHGQRLDYVPTASIDHHLRTFYFANYFHVQVHGRAMTTGKA